MDEKKRHFLDMKIATDLAQQWGNLLPLDKAKAVVQWVQHHNVWASGYFPTPAELWRAVMAMHGTVQAEPSQWLGLVFVLRSAHYSD